MVLYVVRHGQTDYNVQRRYAGSTDISLNDTGLQQAYETARMLKSAPLQVVACSPLKRARQTADCILKSHPDAQFMIIEEFAERNVGVYEGLTGEEIQQRYPELWQRQSVKQLDDAPYGGETIREFDARVERGMVKLKEKYNDKTVLIVCHGFVSRSINRIAHGTALEEMDSFLLDNCQIARYEI